jgi:hypothetical protein
MAISPLLHRTGRVLRIETLSQRVPPWSRHLTIATPDVARLTPSRRPSPRERPTTSWDFSDEVPTWEDAEWQ